MLSKETIIEAKNNTSLFQEFIKNSTKSPSPKAQQNFLNIITNVADIIKKICISEKLIFDVNYDGKKYWEQGKNIKLALLTEVSTAVSYPVLLLMLLERKAILSNRMRSFIKEKFLKKR